MDEMANSVIATFVSLIGLIVFLAAFSASKVNCNGKK